MSLLQEQNKQNLFNKKPSLSNTRSLQIESFARHVAARLFQIATIIILAGIPLFLFTVRFYGLGNGIRHRVEKSLSGQFYDVKIHRLLFSLSDGIIAEDLRLLEHNPSRRLLVHANRVTIFPNLTALSIGSIEIESFQLHKTNIDVPLGNAEEPRLRLDHVEAKIVCPPGQLTLSNANFDICGIHTHATGNFLNPKTFAPHPVSQDGPGKIAQTINLIQEELLRIHWEGAPPTLDIEVSGDLTHTKSLRADHVTFHSGACKYGPWRANAINAELEYSNLQLKLHQLFIEDQVGELHLSGNANFEDHQASLTFSGASDLAALAALAFPKSPFTKVTWIDPPHLEGSTDISWKSNTPLVQSEMHIDTGRFSYQGINMTNLSAGCILQEGHFLMRDLHLEGDPGSLEADLLISPNDYRVRINANILPQLLLPAATGNAATILSLFNFKDPFKINFEGKGTQLDPFSFEGGGSFTLGSSSMRGAWIDSLTSTFQFKEGIINFQNILAKIGEGVATGSCIYDVKEKEISFPKVKSTLDPIIVMMWIDPRIAESLKDYRFHQIPETEITGHLGLKDPQKNALYIKFNTSKGLDYTLVKRNLTFRNVTGTVAIKNQDLLVNIPSASLFGGNISLQADASIIPGNGRLEADVNLNGVDFQSLTKLYFDYDTSEGKLNGLYHFVMTVGDDYSMTGKGNLLIKDGNVLAMPIFGPLSVLMNDIAPGLGYQAARQATADFTIQKGVINTKNLSIQSAEFSMIGSGDIFYLEDKINMQMRLNVKGLPGLVLFPVSKLFEYTWNGSIKNSTWRPKYMTLPKLHSK